MKVSINTAVFLDELNAGKTQLECLQTLEKEDNIAGIQVRDEFFKDDMRAEELDAIHELAQKKGWMIDYSVPQALFTDDGLNPELGNFLNLAQSHGIDALKFSLGAPTKESIKEAELLIKPSGVSVSVENEGNDHGEPAYVLKQLAEVTQNGVIGFTFDAGNWYWVDKAVNVNRVFLDLKDYVTVLHLKNIDVAKLDTTLLEDGDTDWRALVANKPAEVPVYLEYNIPTEYLGAEMNKITQFDA
ncbi:MAG: xylose isomerase [Aerococcus sp.]|nr:xylose isomerase [Aerococcus sp.]